MNNDITSNEVVKQDIKKQILIPIAFLVWGVGSIYFGVVLNSAPDNISYLHGVFFICLSIITSVSLVRGYYYN